MEVKQKLYPHTVLCRLQYENGYLYEGEIMEEYLAKGQPPKPLVYEKWPDKRIYGYGKLTQPNGKVVIGKWAAGKPNPRITIHKNGKRVYAVPKFLLWEANEVTYTADHQFVPGTTRKNCRNEWNQGILEDIIAIEESIDLQQQALKDAPIYEARIGDSKLVYDRAPVERIQSLKRIPDSKKRKTKKRTPIGQALYETRQLIGIDGMDNGDRVCAILADLVPKLEKERRRIKFAYAAQSVAVLLTEPNAAIAQREAVKRLIDYTDMTDDIAKEIITELYEALI